MPCPRTANGKLGTVPFESLFEAQKYLFGLLHIAFEFLVRHTHYKFIDSKSVPESITAWRQSLVDSFRLWRNRLSLLEQTFTGDPVAPATSSRAAPRGTILRKGLCVLKLHWQTVMLLLMHSLSDQMKETSPSFDDVAEQQLQLAREVICSSVDSDSSSSSSSSRSSDGRQTPGHHGRSFSLELGVVTPIFLLALKTEKMSVREAAVDLLQEARGWREGFHDAEAMAKLVAGLEERTEKASGTDADIPMSDEVGAYEARTQALEWQIDPVMNVRSWNNDAERLDGWERLWTAVA